MGFLQQLQEQIKQIWQKLSKTQKFVVVGGTSLVFLILISYGFILSKPKYEPLYPNLNINDSATIAAKLKDMKIDYKLGSDGTTILVPAAQKYQLRLDLANELPRGGVVGFESFNETRFGETDTDKRIRYLAALQGELTRTIEQMTEVETANVHIVLPETSLFIEDEKPTTASVLLKFKPYANINKSKIKSIINFLSHSVEGLHPENVTIIDVNGNLLSEGVIDDSNLSEIQLSVNQMDIKKRYEEDLAKSLQTMLEKVKGPGRAVVRVSAELNFDQIERSSTEYGNSVLRSEQVKEESFEGTSEGAPPVGAVSNIPDVISYQGTSGGTSNSESSETIRNYEISQVVEHVKKSPGEVARLSVAVIIDGQLSAEEEEVIEDIISKAAGINETRGDSVRISSLPFNTADYAQLQEQMEEALAKEKRMELIKYLVYGLGIIGSLIVVYLFLRRVTTNVRPGTIVPTTIKDINYEEMLQELTPQDNEKIQVQKRIEKIAKTQPDSAAQIIKTWLAEDTR